MTVHPLKLFFALGWADSLSTGFPLHVSCFSCKLHSRNIVPPKYKRDNEDLCMDVLEHLSLQGKRLKGYVC